MKKLFRNLRIKIASKFGKIEHKAGRLLGLLIFLDLILLCYITIKYGGLYLHWVDTLFILLILTFLCWIIYITSHTLEKKIYGKHGFR